MNNGFEHLQAYPFERLRVLTEAAERAPLSEITLTIGEPQHDSPNIVIDALRDALTGINKYPLTAGTLALRESIARWLTQRFKLSGIDAQRQILPVNGTREALFAIAQTIVTPGHPLRVVSPNPFYQIYEGAALLAGTRPRYLAADKHHGFLPDFMALSPAEWEKTELVYICTPGNPSGAVMSEGKLHTLIKLAETHDFVIASDECYSEIYPDENDPPPGLLQAAASMGNRDFKRCLAFHSLSKRSNLPGLRSGFVAGDADLIDLFLRYRTYHGCAMPPHHQIASAVAWADEQHVIENRRRYREKFDAVLPLLSSVLTVSRPDAGFYLWPETPINDEHFAIELLRRCNVAVLPGRYLGREVNGYNPAANYARLALVAELAQCLEAAERITDSLQRGW